MVNFRFSQQVVKGSKGRKSLKEPHPFAGRSALTYLLLAA